MFRLAVIDWSFLRKPENVLVAVRVLAILVVGYLLFKLLAFAATRALKKRLTDQSSMLVRKGIAYTGVFVVLLAVLNQLGFTLTAILGAAGIFGVALAFASQTSVSNIISGLFLISEKPFAVGNIVTVENTTGIVMSIDLLSVKVRTFDNKYVRIPNENLIRTQVTNITRFPIRRVDVNMGVAYKEDIGRVEAVLRGVASRNPFCLDEPEPIFMFKEFGDSALSFLFGVWCANADYVKLRNSIHKDIKERFDAEGIEIPFPHRTLYAGSVTDAMPVRLVAEEKGREEAKTQGA
jgi:small-conductance mechanosensitive channel